MEKKSEFAIDINPMREKVRDELQRMIVNQEIKPGEKIVETEWAAKLGVSKAPIREAIRELEVMGLVDTISYKGTFVRKLTPLDIAHVAVVRGSLEATAAKYMINNITEEELIEFEKLYKALHTLALEKDEEEYYRVDLEFHKRIVLLSGNAVLYRLWRMLNVDQWSKLSSKLAHKNLRDYAAIHAEIFQSIKKRNGEAAVLAIQKHFDTIYKDSIKEYERTKNNNTDENVLD